MGKSVLKLPNGDRVTLYAMKGGVVAWVDFTNDNSWPMALHPGGRVHHRRTHVFSGREEVEIAAAAGLLTGWPLLGDEPCANE